MRRLHCFFAALVLTTATPALAHDTVSSQPAHAEPAAITIGDIAISGAFSRATLPNAPVGGGFMTLTNSGADDDVLLSASAPIAAETQLHEMAVENDVMKMRQRKDGIPLPAGETVVLAPGGLHMMFMGLTGPLVEGQTIPVTLTFEKAGTITVDLAVGATAADAPAHGTTTEAH